MPERWDNAAELRKEQIESGLDLTFSKVFLPYYKDLVINFRLSSVLEFGCGTGHLSFELSKIASKVVAVEPSKGMHAVAYEVLKESGVELINKQVQDISFTLSFDLIFSHMCIQTANDVGRIFNSVRKVMNNNALFVFAIPHPCFYNGYKKLFSSNEYSYIVPLKKNIAFSISKDPDRSIYGVPYNHRPLSWYFNVIKKNNMFVDDFHEIIPEPTVQNLYGSNWETPRYCVFHVKRH